MVRLLWARYTARRDKWSGVRGTEAWSFVQLHGATRGSWRRNFQGRKCVSAGLFVAHCFKDNTFMLSYTSLALLLWLEKPQNASNVQMTMILEILEFTFNFLDLKWCGGEVDIYVLCDFSMISAIVVLNYWITKQNWKIWVLDSVFKALFSL